VGEAKGLNEGQWQGLLMDLVYFGEIGAISQNTPHVITLNA
jgi:hypothetical protein